MNKEDILKALEELSQEEFDQFKWFLHQPETLPGVPGIKRAVLEKTKSFELVNLMVQTFTLQQCLQVTCTILEKMCRNDLRQRLSRYENPGNEMKWPVITDRSDLKSVQQFAVDVTLDPDTAHPNLILSDDGKQETHGDVWKNLPEYPERFSLFTDVLAEQSFTSGRFYFEVQVKGKTDWDLGVARESVERKGETDLSTENGFWTIILRDGNQYFPGDDDSVNLHLHPGPQKVGVFVDYEEGLVSFYDVDAAAMIYSFTGCCFKEKLYPFFGPFLNQGGTNSACIDYLSPKLSSKIEKILISKVIKTK